MWHRSIGPASREVVARPHLGQSLAPPNKTCRVSRTELARNQVRRRLGVAFWRATAAGPPGSDTAGLDWQRAHLSAALGGCCSAPPTDSRIQPSYLLLRRRRGTSFGSPNCPRCSTAARSGGPVQARGGPLHARGGPPGLDNHVQGRIAAAQDAPQRYRLPLRQSPGPISRLRRLPPWVCPCFS